LRKAWLYRSGQHLQASPADLAGVAAIGLKAVVDMRGDHERKIAPCPRPAGFAASVVFASDDRLELPPHVEAGRTVRTVDEARQAMCAGYAEMPFMDRLVRITRLYFETLANTDGPTLVHCMAGKDRTGIAVALCHSLLGVHHDDIIADYVLTNETHTLAARIAVGEVPLRQSFGDRLSPEAVALLCSAEPAFLEAALDSIAARHGGIDAYLDEVVGVTPARRERIARRLIV
jgi:protein tyrosine/serine phosphatase